MPLSQEQAVTVKKWIDSRIPNYHCPVCPSREYSLNDLTVVYTPRPMVELICSKCAYIMNFAADKVGV